MWYSELKKTTLQIEREREREFEKHVPYLWSSSPGKTRRRTGRGGAAARGIKAWRCTAVTRGWEMRRLGAGEQEIARVVA